MGQIKGGGTHNQAHIQPLPHERKATEIGEGDATGLNAAKYMISPLLWIISIDLYLVLQYSLIKAVWNKPVL